MRAILDLACKDCGTILHKTLLIKTEQEAFDYEIECPSCKAKNSALRAIPQILVSAAIKFTEKGYKLANVYPKTLTIQFKEKYFDKRSEDEEFVKILKNDLPHEFTLDCSEEIYDLLYNERIQCEDFEGIDRDEYFEQAAKNIEKFADILPTIGIGFAVNMDAEIKENLNLFDKEE